MSNAGRYNHRLIIQQPTDTEDALGGVQRSWAQREPWWASKRSMIGAGGGEAQTANQPRSSVQTEWRGHYRPGVSPEMRVLAPGETTTLATGVSSGWHQIKVSDADGFPRHGQYRVRVGNELMEVTSGQGTTAWVVERGMDGTTAASATQGTTVTHMEVHDIETAWNEDGVGREMVVRTRRYNDGS